MDQICNNDKINENNIKRRTRVPDKPNYGLNLWSIIKSFIGKDLTKIPLPVNFNEPLSMLQRSAEDYEYSELLDTAAKCENIAEQFAYVAAFTMSTYSTTTERVAKPFNPMLGETYECDRSDDLGWKLISEQVSHHPPVLAQFCESKNGWKCSQELQLTSKLGKHITAIPTTFSRIEFLDTETSFTFDRPITTVHNLIIGKLYVEHSGDVTILGEGKAKGWKCVLSYKSSSFFFRGDQRAVKGLIYDECENVKLKLNAHWDEKMEILSNYNDNNHSKVIWRKRLPPSDSYLYYNFTIFASQLNEMEAGVAPTDSRHRPDQRLMEEGDWDESNREKVRLEEQQREKRRLNQDVKPLWFNKKKDDLTGAIIYKYNGKYWECKNSNDWSKCPAIF
ncbi:CLUMA_CG002152, isoform A [Clunio marinus]|uniref:CLUMA_CG002152, isoform A n=1 Tax=Clunio marinus TaxID=568069 RepID=A0A1J1HK06_9DIPT|nr:CLUMA_CG002152, isoform A [Clunio marinus]